MTLISLTATQEPEDGVRLEQPHIRCKWENLDFGFGTLYITEKFVIWISDRDDGGFTLTYPSIGIYGQTACTEQDPAPALFMQVDLRKTDISIAPHRNGNANGNGYHVENEDDDETEATATLRFIPEEATTLQLLIGLISECQAMNPDPADEQADDYGESLLHDDDVEQAFIPGADLETEDGWFTAETPDDEVRLSAEGRANLERIVGDLNIDPSQQSDKQEDHFMEEE